MAVRRALVVPGPRGELRPRAEVLDVVGLELQRLLDRVQRRARIVARRLDPGDPNPEIGPAAFARGRLVHRDRGIQVPRGLGCQAGGRNGGLLGERHAGRSRQGEKRGEERGLHLRHFRVPKIQRSAAKRIEVTKSNMSVA